MKQLIILFFSITLFGCATSHVASPNIEYVSTPLNRPTMPDLEKVTGKEMACLSDETKAKLIKRDDQLKYYIGELETIIDSTHTQK